MNRIFLLLAILMLPIGLLGQAPLPEDFVDLKQKIAAIRDSIDQAVRERMTPLDRPSWPYLHERIEWKVLKDYDLLWVEHNHWATAEQHTNEVFAVQDPEVRRAYHQELKRGVDRMGKVRSKDTDPIWMAQVFDKRYIIVSSQGMDTTPPHYYSYYLVLK